MTRGMPDAAAFARTWADEWNSHDLGSILAHYAPDVAFRSPLAARVLPGSDGTVRGLAGLREYWSAGLAAHPDLRFEVLGVFEGTDTLVILFRNEAGELRAEALTFRDGLIVEGRGMFPAGQGIPDQRERAACRRMSPVAAGVVAAGVRRGWRASRRRETSCLDHGPQVPRKPLPSRPHSPGIGRCGRSRPHEPENASPCKKKPE
ncbi:MAG TPA: nuclear transport factor 2 family protein [Trebonia sp.]|nr:nuclear transport factor 2 family protein [Trebonia sp.]